MGELTRRLKYTLFRSSPRPLLATSLACFLKVINIYKPFYSTSIFVKFSTKSSSLTNAVKTFVSQYVFILILTSIYLMFESIRKAKVVQLLVL